jgi:hypothetical protein
LEVFPAKFVPFEVSPAKLVPFEVQAILHLRTNDDDGGLFVRVQVLALFYDAKDRGFHEYDFLHSLP